MAMAVIEISTIVEISFCEALMRMSFRGLRTDHDRRDRSDFRAGLQQSVVSLSHR